MSHQDASELTSSGPFKFDTCATCGGKYPAENRRKYGADGGIGGVIPAERQALIQGLHDCACDPREREKHPGRIRGNPTGVTAQGDLASGSWAASPTVSTRRDAHLAFCHIVLPNLVFSGDGPAFMRELLGPGNGRRALADHWNRITGNDRSLRTRRRDFAVSTIRSKEELEAMGFTDRHLSPVDGSVQPRWSVVTITPPPALEQAEVHVIGLLIDWSHIDHLRNLRTPLAEAASSGESGVRYFCLERGASPETTFMGEWCHPCPPGVRRNLGPGPAPSVETMAKFLSDLVFLDFQAKTSHKPSGKQSVVTDADETINDMKRRQLEAAVAAAGGFEWTPGQGPGIRFSPNATRKPGQILKSHVTLEEMMEPGDKPNWGWVDPPEDFSEEEVADWNRQASQAFAEAIGRADELDLDVEGEPVRDDSMGMSVSGGYVPCAYCGGFIGEVTYGFINIRDSDRWEAGRDERSARAWRIQNNPCTCRHDLQPGQDLKLANLSGANLKGANLKEADLEGADLTGADLTKANLSGANLREADLSGAHLNRADLTKANLEGAMLNQAHNQAHLGGARASKSTTWPKGFDPEVAGVYEIGPGANLKGADLREADLEEADLEGANLNRADLTKANLSVANLREADLSGANLQSANLQSANLKGADLTKANLGGARASKYTTWPKGFDPEVAGVYEIGPGANLVGADLAGAWLFGANLAGADFTGADLSGANLNWSNLKEANLEGANLKGANLKGTRLDGANLKGADLTKANLGGASLEGAKADETTVWTVWPEGFDPKAAGVTFE